MQYKKKRIVFVTEAEKFKSPHRRKRLWLAARNLKISRRNWPDEIADAIYNFDGDIMVGSIRWPIPDIDNILGDPRWFSYYFEEDEEGEPRRNVRLLERLRLIDLYFKIKHPNIARHFDR